jgi:hypothetical protein
LSLLTSLAPELVIAEDIVELDLDGQPVRDDKRTLYLEHRRCPCLPARLTMIYRDLPSLIRPRSKAL